jgi:hypothetical protein
MKMIWKKWITASWGTRIILAFLYLYISLTISLNHTCNLYSHKASGCYADGVNHCHEMSGSSEIKTALGEISSERTLQTNSQYCAACLYSLLTKSHGPSPKILSVTIDASSSIKILLQLDFIKQSEYLSSVSLRAPPSIIS